VNSGRFGDIASLTLVPWWPIFEGAPPADHARLRRDLDEVTDHD